MLNLLRTGFPNRKRDLRLLVATLRALATLGALVLEASNLVSNALSSTLLRLGQEPNTALCTAHLTSMSTRGQALNSIRLPTELIGHE